MSGYHKLGHDAEIVTLDDPSAVYLQELDVPVHALGPVSTEFGYTPKLIPFLRRERDRFDGVVVHGLWQYLGFAARRVFHGHKPYMVFPHGMLDPYFKRAYPSKHFKKSLYWIFIEYWTLRGAKRILFTSEMESELAPQTFWPHSWRSSVVPYGAKMSDGDPALLRKLFLSGVPTLNSSNGSSKFYLLFLGRVHPKKGCDLLLDAFSQIADKDPNLQLVLAGPVERELKDELVAKAVAGGVSDRVHWVGMLEGDLKWGALYGCDAFILPSHQENFGIAVAEALACGKPVLISNKVNIWDTVLLDGAAIVANDDAAGTLELLERWLSLTPDARSTMGHAALRSFQHRFNMQKNVGTLITLFSSLTSS